MLFSESWFNKQSKLINSKFVKCKKIAAQEVIQSKILKSQTFLLTFLCIKLFKNKSKNNIKYLIKKLSCKHFAKQVLTSFFNKTKIKLMMIYNNINTEKIRES